MNFCSQIRELLTMKTPETDELAEILKQFRDDELEHKNTAIDQESEKAPLYQGLNLIIQQGCKAAIWIAKKV